MCWRATHAVESFVNQTLRATINVQVESAPSRRCSVEQATGVTRFHTNHWPVLAVNAVRYSPAQSFPRNWNSLASDQWDIEEDAPVNNGSAIPGGAAEGASSILIAPNVVSWLYGRRGYRVEVTYLNGWPHCGVNAAVAVNDVQISVDDVTGFGIATSSAPILATIYDGGNTEVVSVTGITADNGTTGAKATGSGKVTIASGAKFTHAAPSNGIAQCMLSTMPLDVQRATIMLATTEALVRGATATTVPRQPGVLGSAGKADDLDLKAYELLLPFKRVF